MHAELTIGRAAQAAGCSVPTVRYYEEVGLLAPAERTASGHRVYPHAAIDRLRLIRRCRDFGMAIKDITALIAVGESQSECDDALSLIDRHLAELRGRIAELKALERSLALMAARCADSCIGGDVSCCTIYDDLTAPGSRTGYQPSAPSR